MTHLDKQVRTTQRRMWINRWLVGLSWSLTIAVALLALLILVHRLFDFAWPLGWPALAALAIALVAAAVWTFVKREGPAIAAAVLDEAAGLRERLSTAHYCRVDRDPEHPSSQKGPSTSRGAVDDIFVQAVVTDAEHISGSLSARQHIRLRLPGSFAWTTLTALVLAAMFLVPVGLLTSTQAAEEREQGVELTQTKIAVKRQMDRVRKLVQDNPALQELKDKLGDADEQAAGKLHRPGDVRHEAVKKIDKLTDAVKQKRASGKYESVKEMRKMLRGLKVPKAKDAPNQKLAKALAKGDFKTAREELNALKEQLATLKSEQDKELAAKMSKQLEAISKQLDKLAQNENLAKKLAEAGLKPKDIKRMLENLKKEDLEQVKKQLQEKGLNQKQINKLAQQLERGQQAGAVAKKLAQAMKQGASGSNPGQTGESMEGLSMAADQLSQLEQLEQEMNQLDAAMADLNASSGNISKPCRKCRGAG